MYPYAWLAFATMCLTIAAAIAQRVWLSPPATTLNKELREDRSDRNHGVGGYFSAARPGERPGSSRSAHLAIKANK
jgi:hypothetical protein